MIRTDLHTHTSFCDGKDTPQELVAEAYKRGFSSIGITGHSFVSFDDCCMSLEETEQYKSQINALKQQYKGKMDIFLGLEQDYYSPKHSGDFDYTIGSVHYLLKNGEYFPLDQSPDITMQKIKQYYNGDFDLFAEHYYTLLADVVNKTDCDIIGHFDLITKYSETDRYPFSDRYRTLALATLEKLIPYGRPFEINVGAITRGYRTTPYPADFILKEINRLGGTIVINGDCHNKLWLGDYLDSAIEFAKQCGFKERLVLTHNGFKSEKI